MPHVYQAALIGCGRMGATIDDAVRDHPHFAFPYCHAGAYVACEQTELVAAAEVMKDKLESVCRRWQIPHAYLDYRELIQREKPDIISIATRPGNHAEIAIFAAEHGVRGIYCEKPLCCSMAEADAMLQACERHGVKFNLGTNRRYTPVYWKIRELIEGGEIGDLQTVTAVCAGLALWSHTHTSDMLMFLSGDAEAEYVQGALDVPDGAFEDNRLPQDPSILMGFVRFRNGVRGYLTAQAGYDFEVSGSQGKIRTVNDGAQVYLWKAQGKWKLLEDAQFPLPPRESGTLNCVRNLVEALDTGRETKGNPRLAVRSQELIMAMVESHRLGGSRVPLPMKNRELYVGTW